MPHRGCGQGGDGRVGENRLRVPGAGAARRHAAGPQEVPARQEPEAGCAGVLGGHRRDGRVPGGQQAGPLVSLAENVSVPAQNRKEFEELLKRALEIDADAKPEYRLANLVAQRRARWLLGRVDRLFVD